MCTKCCLSFVTILTLELIRTKSECEILFGAAQLFHWMTSETWIDQIISVITEYLVFGHFSIGLGDFFVLIFQSKNQLPLLIDCLLTLFKILNKHEL